MNALNSLLLITHRNSFVLSLAAAILLSVPIAGTVLAGESPKTEGARDESTLTIGSGDTYKAILSKEEGQKAKELQEEITTLMERIDEDGTAEKIRLFWERLVSWFHERSGQAVTVEGGTEQEPEP